MKSLTNNLLVTSPLSRKTLAGLVAIVLSTCVMNACGGGGGGGGGTPNANSVRGTTSTTAPTITITSITPVSGPANGGTQITVTGTNFPTSVTVTFGAAPATSVVVNSTTSATVTTPAHAVGTVDVVVSTQDGTSATLPGAFQYFTPGAALQISTPSPLPDVVQGTVISQQITAIGGNGGAQQWTISSGTLPPGLALQSATGLIVGTPNQGGAFTFTVMVADPSGSTTKQFTLNVVPTLQITAATALTDAILGGTYSQQVSTSGGSGTQVWVLTAGALPAGLTLQSSGLISGVPTTVGQATFTLKVTDARQNASKQFTLNVLAAGITTGAIQNKAYTFTPATITSGGGVITWSISQGTLPAGLSIDPATGTVSGTPTTAGIFNFTISANTANSQTAQSTFIIVSAAAPLVGNQGNPYADEGGAPDLNATPVSACFTPLSARTSYRLTNSITGGTFGLASCLVLSGPGIKLDLNGFTVNGPIYMNTNAAGTVVFNGTVICNNDDSNGGNTGCINLISQTAPTSQIRVHHLTVHNNGGSIGSFGARSIHIDFEPLSPSQGLMIRVYNITSVVNNQPGVTRSHNLNVTAPKIMVEEAYNDFTCATDAQACQGEVCFGTLACYQHGNIITMPFNNTGETARALVFDEVVAGEIFNNTTLTNNSRGVRVRDSTNAHIHDNVFNNIKTSNISTAAVHLADPDFGTDDLHALVENNSFQIDDGKAVFIRNGIDADVRNNTVTCTGTCSGAFAVARTPIATACPANTNRPGVICDGITYETIVSFESNPTAGTVGLPLPQIQVAPLAQATVCHSGTAGAFGAAGTGTIINTTSCP